MVQVGAGHDEGATGFGHLLAVDRDKTMGPDRRWRSEAGIVQHRRPEQGVEIDDVLAYEVVHLGGGIFLPEMLDINAFAVTQVLEAGQVTNGGVQPDIEILAGRVRNFESE